MLLPWIFSSFLHVSGRSGFFLSFSLFVPLPYCTRKKKKNNNFSFILSQSYIKPCTCLLSFHLAKTNMTTSNTDQTQFYTAICGENAFTVPVRYQELTPTGQGAFGAVV
jgi:hypothetical protein